MSRRSTTSTSSSGPGPTSSACGWSGWRCPMPPTTWPTPWRHWSTSSAEAGRGGGRRDRRPHRRAGAGRGGGAGHGGGGRRAVRRQDLHLPGRRADRRGRRRLVPGRQAGRPGAVRPAGDHRPADQLPTRRPAHVRLVPGAAAGAARLVGDVAVRRRRPAEGEDGPGRPGAGEETVAEFFTRRLGPEAYARVVEPLLAGIHAGDATRLSLPATFPRFVEMERDHGGLVRAALSGRVPN